MENLLFNNNIKKQDNSWYTYKDFDNPDIQIWDSKSNKMVSLLEYANNNLYSYFDDDSNRIYANIFEILKNKGINSIRLRLWVDPYDENGNSYGGGHNDLDTTIFIIKQAQKYGFDDFLIDVMYSDFWADPGKSYLPKSWENLSEAEIIQKGYDYTYDVIEKIYKETSIKTLRIQYGNEINNGFLWKYIEESNYTFKPKYDYVNNFIKAAIKATNDFKFNNPNLNIDKNIHLSASNSFIESMKQYSEIIELVDTIQVSYYTFSGGRLEKMYDDIKEFNALFGEKNIVIGETSVPFTNRMSGYINDAIFGLNENQVWNPEIQTLITYQYMQMISKLIPNFKTGFYWWEIGQMYIGKQSWATKEGMEYFQGKDYKSWQDFNNWSIMNCFDKNGIALPVLDVINQFERNIDVNLFDKFDPKTYFNFQEDGSKKYIKYFYENIPFLWQNNYNKKDISLLFFNKNNISAIDNDIDLEIYLDNKLVDNDILKNEVIQSIKDEYDSLMFNQLSFSNFDYDSSTKIGTINISANEDSFYYLSNSNITLKFKVYENYLTNTIDLSNEVISISKEDNYWFGSIIAYLKKQSDYDFSQQIWDYLKISGGATDDNNIWLYDNNKNVNRNAEFFLLTDDNIRRSNNKVDENVLQNKKYWVDNFDIGNYEIYFAIRKGIESVNWISGTKSTFEQVGAESWKYIDLLVYKMKINII